jgi:hypothetical protein
MQCRWMRDPERANFDLILIYYGTSNYTCDGRCKKVCGYQAGGGSGGSLDGFSSAANKMPGNRASRCNALEAGICAPVFFLKSN